MKLAFAFLCFLLSSTFMLFAQDEKTDFYKFGKELKEKAKENVNTIGHKINEIDTSYVEPNKFNYAFMLENSNWYEYYIFESKEENPQRLTISPNMSYKLGAYFGWRWIFLGWSVDLSDIFGKKKLSNKKTEFGLSLYSPMIGGDVYYRKSGSNFKLRSTSGIFEDNEYPAIATDINGFSVAIKGLNAYWVFNNKKFSYPAAYSQSSNQRRSAGSFIAGFSYSQHNIKFDHNQLPAPILAKLSDALKFKEISYSDYSLSFGYTYNWVFAKNFLANISVAPAVAYKKSKMDSGDRILPTLKDMNLDLITRAGVVYNDSKYFVGASLVMHTYDYRTENFYLNNSFGTIRIYAGFNFNKKKFYRSKL